MAMAKINQLFVTQSAKYLTFTACKAQLLRMRCAGDGKALPVPTIVPPKQTTLYVGKIAASISDDLIKQLLDACGTVKSWKRMEDPDTKALKPFGFCEYEEADGVVRALNLLQNLSVGGQVNPQLPLLCLDSGWQDAGPFRLAAFSQAHG